MILKGENEVLGQEDVCHFGAVHQKIPPVLVWIQPVRRSDYLCHDTTSRCGCSSRPVGPHLNGSAADIRH